ncbi:MAG: Fur family transcriptional regulator, ferric uptake regulator [Actinomycetota bacterium]|jgi:Fur family ferric uptake transcriptional regulator|nr:Fur family transcriptional regulator, ferric uptake regulator [Actinomycetota bacterium]
MDPNEVIEALKRRGHRMTSQRVAIVEEIARAKGHIAPNEVTRNVQERLPAVNASTVYRTFDLLEEMGVVSHAHLEHGAEYHTAGAIDHVHLVCSNCGKEVALDESATEPLKREIARHSGFVPDFTHFAISGLCFDCKSRSDG